MKNRVLRFAVFTAFFGFSFLLFTSRVLAESGSNDGKKRDSGNDGIKAMEYMSMLRNNQVTGLLNPMDVLKARAEVESMKTKSGGSLNLDWSSLGPDNLAGRTRALLFDNQDASGLTVFAGGVSGGIYKSTNLGQTWMDLLPSSLEDLVVQLSPLKRQQ